MPVLTLITFINRHGFKVASCVEIFLNGNEDEPVDSYLLFSDIGSVEFVLWVHDSFK